MSTQPGVDVSELTRELYGKFRRLDFTLLIDRLNEEEAKLTTKIFALSDNQKTAKDKMSYSKAISDTQSALSVCHSRIEWCKRLRNQSSMWLRPDEELQIICSLPHVTAVTMSVTGKLSILVEGTAVIGQKQYSTGDWRLVVNLLTYDSLESYLLEDPFVEGLGREDIPAIGRGGYYRTPGRNEAFCFGGRAQDIEEYLEYGALTSALASAIDSINSINEGHESTVQRIFRER